MGQFGLGQPVRRVEDRRLITGAGRYTDDISLPGEAYGYVLRSPHAHARIASLDLQAAAAMPGVLRIFTNSDLIKAGLGTIPSGVSVTSRDGKKMVEPKRPLLADGMVRHVGEAVAFIVAETLAQARDAADAIEVDYDALPAVGSTEGAVAPDAPQIWDDAPENVCLDWEQGDGATTDRLFEEAYRIVTLKLVNNRLVSNPLEPRNALAEFKDGRYTLFTTTQGGHGIRHSMAKDILHIEEDRIRVVTPDVGGGFGTKIFPYPEQALTLFAASELGRPVKWTGERSDSFLADAHGRDNVTTAQLALARDGRFLALKVDTIANLGAYISPYGAFVITRAGTGMLPGLYQLGAAHVRVRGVFTNTTPVDAYRGAGRPEASYVIERMVDHAARVMKMDPAEIRRINFITPEQMPYRTALGHTYDSGDFRRNLDDALRYADAAGFPARKAAARAKGKLLGLGISTYVEACAGGGDESATLQVAPDGHVTILIGTQSNGQGHATAYSQIVADRLGITPDQITVIQGDTDIVLTGKGTGGSRSIPVGGAAVAAAAKELIDKGKRLAAHYLETAYADIEFANGNFTVAGTDRRISFQDLAKRALDEVPPGETPGLDGTEKFAPPQSTYPNGCHIIEMEIDAETGSPKILRYTVVDDFGVIVNPMMLAGQVHGGIAQGIGQAMLEDCVYDAESGQLLTGSFMDYCMPRADDLPAIDFHTNVVPCTTNPLGVKGAGEAGAIGAPPAAINAIIDALSEFGVEHIDMPATPFKIWSILRKAGTKQAAE
jgi:carbon-monoxide dehydrogenase large subunit